MGRRFTLVELLIAVSIMSLLIMTLMRLFIHDAVEFGELEHRLKLQADSRIALDLMYRDVAGAYRFDKIDPATGEFELFAADEAPTELAESLRGENPKIGELPNPESLFLRVNKVRYFFKERVGELKMGRTLFRAVIPGILFLKSGRFEEKSTASRQKKEFFAIRNVERMTIEPFTMDRAGLFLKVTDPRSEEWLSKVCLIIVNLKLHKFEQEAGGLELLLKFYSRPIVSARLFPGYFSTIDRHLEF